MRIIHCADLHLDSKLNTNLDKDKAKNRRSELLGSFSRMVQYAADNGIGAILISGDLFDTRQVSETVKAIVTDTFVNNPDIIFYYLRGNHDDNDFIASLDSVPENVKTFGDKWTAYKLGKRIVINGMELNDNNSVVAFSGLNLIEEDFNIVMLHGQEAVSSAGDKAEIINLNALKNKNIDYLALGHVHSYKTGKLDARGTYAYPGCLEGRGFDECGEHGFIVLDIDEVTGEYKHSFVPFARRTVYEIHVDISDCDNSAGILGKIRNAAAASGCSSEDMLKAVLDGKADVSCEKNTEYIERTLQDEYYAARLEDRSTFRVDPEEYMHDESLKGEYVRMVLGDESLREEDKAEIIRIGFAVLDGGDPV